MAITNLIPFPGTEARRICLENKYLTKEAGIWSNYYFSINSPIPLIETPWLSGKQLIAEVKRAYRKMYFNPAWIFRALGYMSPRSVLMGIKMYFGIGKRGAR